MKNKSLQYLKMAGKLSIYGLVITLLLVNTILASNGAAQNVQSVKKAVISLSINNSSLEAACREIERHSDFRFVFLREDMGLDKTVSIKARNKTVEEVLLEISKQANVSFKQVNQQISVRPQEDRDIEKDIQVIIDQVTITGKITDENGEGLPGATVQEKGTSNGTITDVEGNYSLKANDGNVLVISFVGYQTIEEPINGRTSISVSLPVDVSSLEEVVVVGYGTQKKVNLTGSVEQVDGNTLTKQPVFQVSSALTGTVPGLTIVQNSGQPGKDVGQIRIRGLGSLGDGSKNDPLVLIDGVQGDINGIDPGDIEDISVLKDAAAASIYGSRGANGVILITTKRAKAGGISVGYKTYLGRQAVTDRPKFVGALTFLENDGNTPQNIIDDYRTNLQNGTNPDVYTDTDWVDELYSESGFMQYHQVSVGGGSETLRVNGSISYQDQDGNIPNFNFRRYNGRFNSDLVASEKLDFNFDINFSQSRSTEPAQGLTNITQQAFRIPPIYFVRHSDGSWGDGWNGQNPIAFSEDGGLNAVNENYFRGILRMNYKPVKGLNLSLMYSPEYRDYQQKEFVRPIETIVDYDLGTTRLTPNRASLSHRVLNSLEHNVNATAAYSLDFGASSLTALAGYEMIKHNSSDLRAYRDQFILPDYQVLNAGSEENDSNYGSATHNGLLSYFGRVNYSYQDKYLFEANVRRDASSRFSPDNRVSVFPSFSVGWRIAEEAFLQNSDAISDLKLRASWGQLGNQQIGSDFPYVSSISLAGNYVFGGSIYTAATQNVLANSAIQWETTETTNIGIDAGFLENRLTLTMEYYVRKTNDILLEIPIPLNVGLSPSTQNAASVENKGWDLALGWQDDINDFQYSARFIASDFVNEVTDLAGVGPIISGGGITQVGEAISSIYGYETQGIFQTQEEIDNAPAQFGSLQPGNLRYKDQLTVDTNGDGVPDQADGVINGDDRVIIGNSLPRMSYSFDLGARYKGFDFSIAFQGVGNRDIRIGGDAAWAMFNGGKIQEWHMEETWTPERTDAKFPILVPTSAGSNDIQNSSTWIFNGAYLRLRNINFGYSLPATLMDNIFLSSARIFFSGQNLITWDKLPDGMDPQVPSGTNGDFYPIVSSYTMGIEVKF